MTKRYKFDQCEEASIVFKNEDQQVVYGWASVIEEDGEPIEDLQGDVIDEADLVKAAHEFMLDARAGKIMHVGKQVADVVESVVLTRGLQKALGIDLGKAGWFIGMKIGDSDIWGQVKKGDFPAFSIGGTGHRVEI